MTDSVFIELMSAAISTTDGSEEDALAMFELQLLERNDPRLVWDLFEPVRVPLLRRLYGMARHQIEQDSEAQPTVSHASSTGTAGTASEPYETADSPDVAGSLRAGPRHSAVSDLGARRRLTPSHTRSRSPRSTRSAQDVLISIGGKKSHLDWLTNHRGVPIGDLTYYGLANSHDEAPMFQRFASRLMDSGIPKSDRASDVVRKFITPDEADRIWLDLIKEVA